ncbi:NUDIX hydrolase [Pseudonocardia kunmingensis]|uniref:NUDIX hydrolase n=1 Tax=Pseudonocardia kunmingensis TaxID=630975 RepID=UPI00114E2E06|nr:NUDIX domain-containing protein [Pseudonocardia kunmingensis]
MPPAPVDPRPAATVLLLRDHPAPPPGRTPLQVFLQRRVAGMVFAGGMTVFPGGGVDAGDRTEAEHWTGPDSQWWGDRFGHPAELGGALVHAAVRETFEECGVLLAGPDVPPGTQRYRDDLLARRRTLGDVLTACGLALRADLLRPWARWITPPGPPRRYDTAFFAALVPEGQEADAHTTEAVEATWWHPDEALEHWRRGEMQLMPPTSYTLQEIAEHAESGTVLDAAAGREIRPIVPGVRKEGDLLVAVLPDETAVPAAGFPDRPA